MKPLVATVAVLVALAAGGLVYAQTPDIDALRARAEEGDADAQADLGFRYSQGRGVREDDVEAVRWYRLAAYPGYASAQFNVGVMYANGEGLVSSRHGVYEVTGWRASSATPGPAPWRRGRNTRSAREVDSAVRSRMLSIH